MKINSKSIYLFAWICFTGGNPIWLTILIDTNLDYLSDFAISNYVKSYSTNSNPEYNNTFYKLIPS